MMTAEQQTTTAHMDTESDRHAVGWIQRTVTTLEDGMRDTETQPITVAEAIEIVGDRDQVITETQETIAQLREQEATRRQELANGEWPAEDEDDLRDDLERWVQATDDLVDGLREATTMRATRSGDAVEIDAQAERTEDGRWHVSVAAIRDGVAAAEPWYEDTLAAITQADLDKLADEALAAHS